MQRAGTSWELRGERGESDGENYPEKIPVFICVRPGLARWRGEGGSVASRETPAEVYVTQRLERDGGRGRGHGDSGPGDVASSDCLTPHNVRTNINNFASPCRQEMAGRGEPQ